MGCLDKTFESFESIRIGVEGKYIAFIKNSVGSNIFINLEEDIPLNLGAETSRPKSKWRLWLSMTAWRIMRGGKYALGCEDSADAIRYETPQHLVGLRIKSLETSSRFMDLTIILENGYVIRTFMHTFYETQWVVFFPNGSFAINYEPQDERDRVARLGKVVSVRNDFVGLKTLIDGAVISEVFYEDEIIHLKTDIGLGVAIGLWFWRLEQDSMLQAVSDPSEAEVRPRLEVLRGLTINRVECADHMMETRFHIGGYILHTFVASTDVQCWWGIYEGFSTEERQPIDCLAVYPPQPIQRVDDLRSEPTV